jgi:predicted NUDIX family NTP pyrophosphohydrolase
MVVHSAALLLHRRVGGSREVFLGHMGGPYWARKDDGAWSVPKGEFDPVTEDAADAARREFAEEIGLPWEGPLTLLGEFRQPSGKVLVVHVALAEAPMEFVASNEFELEWPRGSGRMRWFPEIDRAAWFGVEEARSKVVKGQVPVLEALAARLV